MVWRSRLLEKNGVTANAILTYDIQANVSGGVDKRAGQLANFDLTFAVDTEKAGLWKNGTFFFYFLADGGDDPSDFVGEFQVVNNIDSPDAIKLYEAWYDHQFLGGNLSALFGLYNFNSEFYSLDYAGTLINSSFGIGVEVAQVGPSIFPTTSLALRIKSKPSEQTYLMGTVLDGVPGDPNNYKGTHIKYKKDDGLFFAAEAGVTETEGQSHFKHALGGWYHSAAYEDFKEIEHTSNFGFYAIGEHSLFVEEDDSQGLGIFYLVGFAAPDRNRAGNYFGSGISYTGLFPGRNEDIAAIAFAYGRSSRSYRDYVEPGALGELILEATYRVVLSSYLSLQPDIQYVHRPDASSDLSDAVVLGLRSEIAF